MSRAPSRSIACGGGQAEQGRRQQVRAGRRGRFPGRPQACVQLAPAASCGESCARARGGASSLPPRQARQVLQGRRRPWRAGPGATSRASGPASTHLEDQLDGLGQLVAPLHGHDHHALLGGVGGGAGPRELHIRARLALDGRHGAAAAAQHGAHHRRGHDELELQAGVIDGPGVALRVAARGRTGGRAGSAAERPRDRCQALSRHAVTDLEQCTALAAARQPFRAINTGRSRAKRAASVERCRRLPSTGPAWRRHAELPQSPALAIPPHIRALELTQRGRWPPQGWEGPQWPRRQH